MSRTRVTSARPATKTFRLKPKRRAAGSSTLFYLVEASVENPLDLFVVERDPLDLAALVFVVEGHGFTGG